MSLPGETNFPCAINDHRAVRIIFEGSVVTISLDEDGMDIPASIDRAQVESLRDQLTEWLEVSK